MKKRLLVLILLSVMVLSFISGCGDKKTDENDFNPILSPNFVHFSNIGEYYDYFFSPYVYENISGEIKVMEYPQADYEKCTEQRGENYYHFVNNIQKGYKKIYDVRVADSWEPVDITIYPTSGHLMGFTDVCFFYKVDGKYIDVNYSYIPAYEYVKNTTCVDSVLNVCQSIYWKYEKNFDEMMEKNFEKPFEKEIKLKDRAVEAAVYKKKTEDKYKIYFVYDELIVSFGNIMIEDFTDDFFKELYLEEYIPPETAQPAA